LTCLTCLTCRCLTCRCLSCRCLMWRFDSWIRQRWLLCTQTLTCQFWLPSGHYCYCYCCCCCAFGCCSVRHVIWWMCYTQPTDNDFAAEHSLVPPIGSVFWSAAAAAAAAVRLSSGIHVPSCRAGTVPVLFRTCAIIIEELVHVKGWTCCKTCCCSIPTAFIFYLRFYSDSKKQWGLRVWLMWL
jgi:hypothetical protein